MKKIVIAAAIAVTATLMPACQKNNDKPHDTQDSQEMVKPVRPKHATDGGGDDDNPKIIHIVKNSNMQSIQNASVLMTNDTDSLQVPTDATGSCTFNLPHAGDWRVRITHEGYQPTDTVINCPNLTKVATSVLQDQ